jgi:pimeloyl-ACP methyl ester carboxylesterase
MATFVLVHGAWHGAWCWELVRPRLEAEGHRVIAEDLPGLGQDKTPLGELTLDLWARTVARLCAEAAEKVILVGHSRGGLVISQAAEYAAPSIARLVYLSAFLAPSGQSLNDVRALDGGGRPLPAAVTEDGMGLIVVPTEVRGLFYHLTPDDLAARAASLLVPEPLAPLGAATTLSEERFGRIPRAYIECLRDQAIPLTLQRRMVQAMPCDPVLSIDTDHSPFYSAPAELTRHLISLA